MRATRSKHQSQKALPRCVGDPFRGTLPTQTPVNKTKRMAPVSSWRNHSHHDQQTRKNHPLILTLVLIFKHWELPFFPLNVLFVFLQFTPPNLLCREGSDGCLPDHCWSVLAVFWWNLDSKLVKEMESGTELSRCGTEFRCFGINCQQALSNGLTVTTKFWNFVTWDCTANNHTSNSPFKHKFLKNHYAIRANLVEHSGA